MTSTHHPEGEPWTRPESTRRRIPGRSFKPTHGPEDARCAALTFDADHDTIPLRDGAEASFIAHAEAKGGGWFAPHAEVAAWCRDHARP